METQLQAYILATAFCSVLWMLYVLVKTFPPHQSTVLANERPLLRHVMAALWVTSLLDAVAMLFITVVILIRNFYGLGNVLDDAPSYLALLLFIQYAIFYIVGLTPATVLFIVVQSIRKIETAIERLNT